MLMLHMQVCLVELMNEHKLYFLFAKTSSRYLKIKETMISEKRALSESADVG